MTWPKSLSVTPLAVVDLYTSCCALLQHFCRQNILLFCNKSISTNIYGDTKPQNFWSLKILKIQKLFGSLFWGQFWDPEAITPFSILSCGLGLNYIISPDVSSTFPASFFTVMPNGLTTVQKSMSDRTWPITTLTAFPEQQWLYERP